MVNTEGLTTLNLGRYPDKTRRQIQHGAGPTLVVPDSFGVSFPTQITCLYGSTKSNLAAVQVGVCGLRHFTDSKQSVNRLWFQDLGFRI